MAVTIKKDTRTLVAILAAILIIPLLLLVALLWPSNSPVAKKTIATSPTSSYSSGKVAAAEEETTTSESTSTTSSTTTTKPKATTTTTTAPIQFVATASASKTNENIVQCISNTYTFAGSVQANAAGTATWTWVRWDGTPSGLSGTATFTSDGSTTDSVTPYTFTEGPSEDFTGWIALEVSWSGGNASSSHASFVYSNAVVNAGNAPTGC